MLAKRAAAAGTEPQQHDQISAGIPCSHKKMRAKLLRKLLPTIVAPGTILRLCKRCRQGVPVLLYIALTPAVQAQWLTLPQHSTLSYTVQFQGLPITGLFRHFTVTTSFSPEHLQTSELQVVVETGSADMQDSQINTEIAAPYWFDVQQYPQATFTSRDIQKTASGYSARGVLELKGIQQPIEFNFRWSAQKARAEMSGELTLDRRKFNVGTGEWASDQTIAYPVEVRFDVILERSVPCGGC